MLVITLALGIGLFFVLPLLIARFVAGSQPGFVERVVEGIAQVAIFIGYLLLIGRASDVHRTFQTTAPSTCRSTRWRPTTR